MRRTAFTLVELLMVILIIGMLISLLLPAVNAARLRAREAVMTSTIEQMVIATEAWKNQHGGYPPDRAWSDAEMLTALRRAWPRMTWTPQDLAIVKSMDQAEIIVFWLGGIYDGVRMTGFSLDPRNPLAGPDVDHDPFMRGVLSQRTPPLYAFEETRLEDTDKDGFPEYYVEHPMLTNAPIVYFSARPNAGYLDSAGAIPFYRRMQVAGVAVPYQVRDPQKPAVVRWAAEGKYQIVCAGSDNEYGEAQPSTHEKVFKLGTGFGPGDNDNLASFAAGRIGDVQ